MLRSGDKLIASPVHEKRYTIVIDLDETVVYARDGPLYARSNLKELLRSLNLHGEVIVWTASERGYARAVLREIDPEGIVQHLIYRHKSWFDPHDYTKDLKRLGRNMDYVLIVENTPDCVRANPQNGIIVEDFEITERPVREVV
jgi:TFIIF-interacting CTD phosphatase-like protein